ncbi:MAG: glycosyl hydrolase [Nocardioidaceae bacterium]
MSTSPLRAALHARTTSPASPTRRLTRRLLQVAIGVTAVSLTAMATPTTAGAAAPRMIIGADGDAAGLAKTIGAPLAYHGYGSMGGKPPSGVMVNMKPNVSWHTVATAGSSTTTYKNIVRWAQTLKSRPGPILFAFHHEPEGSGSTSFGTASDYIAAFRRVEDIFKAQGVRNVEYTWQMTSWAFATKSSARNYAAKWYPGDAYVTNVGTDPYNWYNCGPGSGKWQSLQFVMDPSLTFARAHGKKLVVGEFASQSDSRRASWLKDVKAYFVANRDTIRAVFYFQHLIRPGCHWLLQSPADLSAMASIAKDTTNFTAG